MTLDNNFDITTERGPKTQFVAFVVRRILLFLGTLQRACMCSSTLASINHAYDFDVIAVRIKSSNPLGWQALQCTTQTQL